jgi:alcohol oxidase
VPRKLANNSKNLSDHVTTQESPSIVRARKLVVISAGPFSTPLILERSGIGSKSYLESIGVKQVISDLPGVGTNLQDHLNAAEFMRVEVGPDDTSDDIVLNVNETMTRATEEFKHGKGPLATNFIDSAIKLRPSDEEVSKMNPEFQEYWKHNWPQNPDKAVVLSFVCAIRPFFG